MPDNSATLTEEAQTVRHVQLTAAMATLIDYCHTAAVRRGWWTDLTTGESLLGKRNVPEMLCLVHSEISEGLEGYRRRNASKPLGTMDDHLPKYPMIVVELGDAIVRIADLLGSFQAQYPDIDIAAALADKVQYNDIRVDHSIEARKAGGKAI